MLALGPAVAIGRVLRSSLLDVMRQDYVRTARAKGLSERMVVLRHALRNASGPALSMAGLQVGLLLAGVVVVELVFAWPGLGLYTQQSIQQADFPAVIGITLVLGIAYVVINAVVDILQLVADPRLRVIRKGGRMITEPRDPRSRSPPPESVVASVRDLHVSFKSGDGVVRALRGVNLDIRAGEVVALVGESGSGQERARHVVARIAAADEPAGDRGHGRGRGRRHARTAPARSSARSARSCSARCSRTR